MKSLHTSAAEEAMDAAAGLDEDASGLLDVSDVGTPALVGVGFGTGVDGVALQPTTATPNKTAVIARNEAASRPVRIGATSSGSHATRQNRGRLISPCHLPHTPWTGAATGSSRDALRGVLPDVVGTP